MDLLADLEARGLIQETTDRAALAARLAPGQAPLTLYYGCDPTADSLHHGNLIGLIMLRRFQDAGHHAIALAGGATGMIGDPSGRSEERNLLDDATLDHNVAAIKAQIGRIVDLDGSRGRLVDNRDWTQPITLLDFLRDVGKHATINQMLARESVRVRLES
ncbi:MAG: tyrosine--tRNA ligase, partial [Ilumatobacteraceae bacterium]